MLASELRPPPPAARALLDHQVYDAAGRRLARVGDVELGAAGEPIAVHVGPAALARRLGARRLARRLEAGRIAWEELEPAPGHPGALQLRGGTGPVRRHRRRFGVMRLRRRAPA